MRAFDALYARYEGCLFGFILSQLRHRADAEDVFHETFVNALQDARRCASSAAEVVVFGHGSTESHEEPRHQPRCSA